MEGVDPEERQARRLEARRRTIAVRRGVAVAVALLATAGIWLLLFRDSSPEPEGEPSAPRAVVSKPVAGLVREMSPEEQVDQVLLLGFDGTESTAPVAEELRARELGGLLVTRRNWIAPDQGQAFLATLRAAGREGERIPPLMVTAQEGGEYSSLAGLPPSSQALEIGRTGDPAAAQSWALTTANALREAGIDLNLAPVADVATIASPLAGRAFSDDAAVAAQLTAAALRACAEAGIGCAPSHFPGQGAASEDTDEGPATVSLDPSSLAGRDLEPFRAAIAERAPALVVSLAFFAAYDAVTPAALAPEITTELLRGELGFEGVAVTDDLSAGAIKASQGTKTAAVTALAAGADLVQVSSPGDQDGLTETILNAVDQGDLPEERLAEAAGRVLELKKRLGVLDL